MKLTLEQAVTESWTATLSLMENYIGERGYVDTFSGQWVNLDAYWRTDGALRFSRGEALSIGFTVENATDETYREWSVINPAPGRLYAAELGLSW